jgi:hypothetical protein
MINAHNTLHEIVGGRAKSSGKPKVGRPGGSGQKMKKLSDKSGNPQHKAKKMKAAAAAAAAGLEADEDDGYDDGDGDACPSCGGYYKKDEFWIACDACETWYHGKCVKVGLQTSSSLFESKSRFRERKH